MKRITYRLRDVIDSGNDVEERFQCGSEDNVPFPRYTKEDNYV